MTKMTVLNGAAIEELLTIPMAVVKAARPSVVRVLSRLGVSLQWATRPVRRRTRPASSSSSAEIRSKEENE